MDIVLLSKHVPYRVDDVRRYPFVKQTDDGVETARHGLLVFDSTPAGFDRASEYLASHGATHDVWSRLVVPCTSSLAPPVDLDAYVAMGLACLCARRVKVSDDDDKMPSEKEEDVTTTNAFPPLPFCGFVDAWAPLETIFPIQSLSVDPVTQCPCTLSEVVERWKAIAQLARDWLLLPDLFSGISVLQRRILAHLTPTHRRSTAQTVCQAVLAEWDGFVSSATVDRQFRALCRGAPERHSIIRWSTPATHASLAHCMYPSKHTPIRLASRYRKSESDDPVLPRLLLTGSFPIRPLVLLEKIVGALTQGRALGPCLGDISTHVPHCPPYRFVRQDTSPPSWISVASTTRVSEGDDDTSVWIDVYDRSAGLATEVVALPAGLEHGYWVTLASPPSPPKPLKPIASQVVVSFHARGWDPRSGERVDYTSLDGYFTFWAEEKLDRLARSLTRKQERRTAERAFLRSLYVQESVENELGVKTRKFIDESRMDKRARVEGFATCAEDVEYLWRLPMYKLGLESFHVTEQGSDEEEEEEEDNTWMNNPESAPEEEEEEKEHWRVRQEKKQQDKKESEEEDPGEYAAIRKRRARRLSKMAVLKARPTARDVWLAQLLRLARVVKHETIS